MTARNDMVEALRELLLDVTISQNNMRAAAKYDPKWEGCAEAIQPRVDAARAAIAAYEAQPSPDVAGLVERAIREAHLLLTWTYQHAINTDEMPARGWWHVKDLHPGVYNTMNSAEQNLYTALIKLPEDALTAQAAEIARLTAERDKWKRMAELRVADVLDRERRAELTAAQAEVSRLQNACAKSEDEVQQILGKALGFPWYKDDQKNFPGATEADGVCVGDLVSADLANMIVAKVERLQATYDRANLCISMILSEIAQLKEHFKDG